MDQITWKIKSYGKDGDINKVEFILTHSDGTYEHVTNGMVPIETSLSSSSSEAEIIEAVKAQLGEPTLARIQNEADAYKVTLQHEEKSTTEYLKTMSTVDEKSFSGALRKPIPNYDMIITLKALGHYDTVNNWVTNSGSENEKLFWNITPMWFENAPICIALFNSVGLTSEQQATIWNHAASLKNYEA